jgi:O-antigen ligase
VNDRGIITASLVGLILMLVLPYISTFMGESVSSSLIKKIALLVVFILGVLAAGTYWKSLTRAFLTLFPVLFITNKKLIGIGHLINVPPIFHTTSVTIVDVILLVLFLFLFKPSVASQVFSFRPVQYYFLLMAVGILSIFWADDAGVSILYLPRIVMLPLSFYVFVVFFLRDTRNIQYLFHGLLIGSLMSIIFVWPEYFGIKWFSQFIEQEEERVIAGQAVRAGGVIARSEMALFLVSVIPFLFGYGLFYLKRSQQKIVYFYTILLAATLTMTLNRMHILASLFCCGLIFLLASSRKVVRGGFLLAPIFGTLIIGVIFFVIIQNSSGSVESVVSRNTASGRLNQYKAALEVVSQTKGFGVGMNNYLASDKVKEVLGANNWVFRTGNTVHNDFLRIFSEYGISGVFAFLMFAISSIWLRYRYDLEPAVVIASKLGILSIMIVGLSAPALNKSYSLIIVAVYLAIILTNRADPDALQEN